MTLEEARGELGVGLDTSPELVRRAYLRLLKTRKPEVDPQGFARLREAYDFLKAAQEGTEAPRTQAAPEAPAPCAAPADPSVPLTADQQLDAFRSRFRSLPADAPPEMPVQVAREAVEALPEAAEARHWLIQALLAAGRKDEAVKACRDAFQQGHPEFLPEFAERFPEHLSVAEIELLASVARHTFLWGLADHYWKASDWARLGATALVALEAMKRHPESPPPQPAWFVVTILQLHEHGWPNEARELQRRYAAWMEAEGLLEAFQREDVAWGWPLILELGALGDACAPEVRAILARTVMASDLEEAKAQLRTYSLQEPARAAESLALLQSQCPQFYRVLGEALRARAGSFAASVTPAPSEPKKQQPRQEKQQESHKEKKPESRRSKQLLTVLGVVAVLLAVAAVPALILDSDPPEPQKPSQQGAPGVKPTQSARESAKELCDAIPPANQGTGCLYMEELIKAAESSDCSTVAMSYAKVITNVQRTPEPRRQSMTPDEVARYDRIRRARASLEASLRRFCPRAL